jgi:hypothetical protein
VRDGQRTAFGGRGDEVGGRLEAAEEVRVLEDDACSTPWLISGWYGVYAVRSSPRWRIASTTAGT